MINDDSPVEVFDPEVWVADAIESGNDPKLVLYPDGRRLLQISHLSDAGPDSPRGKEQVRACVDVLERIGRVDDFRDL